ncbi:LysR family transcriptional regulator [Aestuariicella hydrocarbonica]|uniref:LysR family transcriptional regulator n=1 Tax=Pseudomaricurvus hydrocarbonicus TaxID=1470433 RepID=A0A9E5JRY1_9GAMM|nr:LysR family transcriptional regulator [Aestuariicella hydrocarbonica]NHO65628.1 LysR family transcriptional regulator [Aestuariicella hydrocarbonica]
MNLGAARKLKLNQLCLIEAISEYRQIGLAADAVGVTQPAASRMLAEIEALFEAKLFVRHAKGVEPTVAGKALASRAKVILLNIRDLFSEINELSAGRGGAVSIGAVTGAALGIVMPAIEMLKTSTPNVNVQIHVENSPILLKYLQEGVCDLILARLSSDIDINELEVMQAKSESVDLLVREGHPLATESNIALADLTAYEWVSQTLPVPIRKAVDMVFIEAGLAPPDKTMTTTSLLLMIARLSASDAIAPVASEVADLLLSEQVGARFKSLALLVPIQVSPYFLISLKDRVLSPAAQALKSVIVKQISDAVAG